MKPEILHNDHMMFLDRALETQRTALLTAMADAGETVLEGTEVQILADVVAQLYACLTECRFVGPLGLAAYAELSSMAASLMLGEWFD